MRLRCYEVGTQIVEDFLIEDPGDSIVLMYAPKPQTVQIWYNGARMTELSYDTEADIRDLLPLESGDVLTFIYNTKDKRHV